MLFRGSPLSFLTVAVVSALTGLALGSFANVCILRMPGDESITRPGSHCPSCGHALRAWENIPLISFLILRGRCRSCRAPISWQYPAVEIVMMALFLFNACWLGIDPMPLLIADVLSFYALTISIIDYRHRIIPDELSLSLVALGLAVAWWNPLLNAESGGHRLAVSLLAGLAGGGIMIALAWTGEKIFKKEALGGGDVKLVAAFGALLGWQGLWASLLFGSLLGGVLGLLLLAVKKKARGDTLPFGPFLCMGAYLLFLLPPTWLNWFFPIFP